MDANTKPPPDAIDRLRAGVFIATDRIKKVGASGDTRLPGDLVPEAGHWDRAFVDLTNARRLVRLSPEACAAVVREALTADPSLAVEIVRAARAAERAAKEAAEAKKPA